MKPLIIYHDNCADGFGAAWAAYKKFGADGAEYLPMNYNDPRVSATHDKLTFPADVTGRDIYILDFSFPMEVMGSLNTACMNAETTMFVRDHHKTHFEMMGLDPAQLHTDHGDNYDLILDPNKSGCVLAWELFHLTEPVPLMLKLIEDRDLWQWKREGTRDFAAALRSEPFTFDWFNWADKNFIDMIDTGAAMNKLFDQQLADITARPIVIDLDLFNTEDTGLAVNCTPQFASEAGNRLAEKSGTYGATWCVGERGQVFVSLRSIGEYDVSSIAKAYGGGGHRNAAGFKTTLDKLYFSGGALVICSPSKINDRPAGGSHEHT